VEQLVDNAQGERLNGIALRGTEVSELGAKPV
jgi:hypothetical protein